MRGYLLQNGGTKSFTADEDRREQVSLHCQFHYPSRSPQYGKPLGEITILQPLIIKSVLHFGWNLSFEYPGVTFQIPPTNGFHLISPKKANMSNKDLTLPANFQWVPNFKLLSQRFSGLIIGIGGLVLIGWMLDIEALKSVVPGLATMKSMTALLFVLSGLSLWMQAREKGRQIAQIFTFIVMLTGLLTLGEYLFRSDFGIDQLLFRDTAAGAIYPGRMSPATALSFITDWFWINVP